MPAGNGNFPCFQRVTVGQINQLHQLENFDLPAFAFREKVRALRRLFDVERKVHGVKLRRRAGLFKSMAVLSHNRDCRAVGLGIGSGVP